MVTRWLAWWIVLVVVAIVPGKYSTRWQSVCDHVACAWRREWMA